jgi:hypothetical protein
MSVCVASMLSNRRRSSLHLFPDLPVTPRVVSSAFGIFTNLALRWLAHELFRHRMITAPSALPGALLPVWIVFGIAALAKIMFMSCPAWFRVDPRISPA